MRADCEAFWGTAGPYLRTAGDLSSLPDYRKFMLWSCPLREMDRTCVPPRDDDRAHAAYGGLVPRLLGFSATFAISYSRYASAAEARRFFDAFEALTVAANAHAPPSSAARQSSAAWATMRFEELLTASAQIGAAISLLSALLVLLAALQNWLLAILAALHVGAIVTCSIGSFAWMGWSLGFVECVACVRRVLARAPRCPLSPPEMAGACLWSVQPRFSPRCC